MANYSGVVPTTGAALPATNVSQTPTILIRGSEVAEANSTGPFNEKNNATASFTVSSPVKSIAFHCQPFIQVILIDGNYPGSDNPNGYNVGSSSHLTIDMKGLNPTCAQLHWLGNSYKILQENDHALTLGNASEVVPYAGPG